MSNNWGVEPNEDYFTILERKSKIKKANKKYFEKRKMLLDSSKNKKLLEE